MLITRGKVDFKNRFDRYAPYRFVPPARLPVIVRQSSDSGPLFLSSYVTLLSERVCRVSSTNSESCPSRSTTHEETLALGWANRAKNPNFVRFGLCVTDHPLTGYALLFLSSGKERKSYRATCLSNFRCLHNAKNLIKPGSSRGKKRVTELIAA